MQKYIVTVIVDGMEVPLTVRAKDEKLAEKRAFSKVDFSKVVSVMSKVDYKKKYNPERQAVSSIESNHRLSQMRIR